MTSLARTNIQLLMAKNSTGVMLLLLCIAFAVGSLGLLCPALNGVVQTVAAVGTFLGILLLAYQVANERDAVNAETLSTVFSTLFTTQARQKRRYIFDHFLQDCQSATTRAIERLLSELTKGELARFQNWETFLKLPPAQRDDVARVLKLRERLLEPILHELDVEAQKGAAFTKLDAVESSLSDLELVVMLTNLTHADDEPEDFYRKVILDVYERTTAFIMLHVACRPAPDYKKFLRRYADPTNS